MARKVYLRPVVGAAVVAVSVGAVVVVVVGAAVVVGGSVAVVGAASVVVVTRLQFVNVWRTSRVVTLESARADLRHVLTSEKRNREDFALKNSQEMPRSTSTSWLPLAAEDSVVTCKHAGHGCSTVFHQHAQN